MIIDINSLIETYRFINNDNCLDNIREEANNLGNIIGKLKFEKIKNHIDYLKIFNLSEMKIKKVRKPLLNSDFEIIKKFNEELKGEYPNKLWIQNLHTKENWINEILNLIKKKSKSLLPKIENISNYDTYEKNRLDFDLRIVLDSDYFSTSFTGHDFKENDREWSSKITCTCIKNIKTLNYLFNDNLFSKGEKYSYRKKINGQINVYPSEYISCIFEDDSFYEYFLSPDSRNRRIDEILS